MLDLMGKGITVVLTLGITASAWAAPSLPGSSADVRALEQNRGARQQQTDLQQKADEETLPQKLLLRQFVFTGQQEIDPAALTEATQGYLGQEVTVTELEQAAAAVTDYCRQQGYTVATAVLPQQNIQDGTVEIRIFLGTLGKVIIENDSRLSDAAAAALAAALERDGYIRTAGIESVLNNFNDLPGISAAGILSAGEAIGSTDLTIALHDGKTAESAIKFLQAGC